MPGVSVVIVGGGVVGLSAAYQLALRRSARVTVIEKKSLGSGSSLRAAGITSGLMWSETGVLARKLSIEWFRRLSQELPGYKYHDENGCLNLFTPETWEERAELLPLYDRLGVEYQVLTASEIHQRWPSLSVPDNIKGLHDPNGGYSEPDDFICDLEKRLRELGVNIVEGEQIEDFMLSGDRVVGVRSSTARYDADAVISGIHSWSLTLWSKLGLRLPFKNFVHQRYLSRPLSEPFVAPAMNANSYLGYIRPARGQRLLFGVETPLCPEHNIDRADFTMDDLAVPNTVRDEAVGRFAPLVPTLHSVQWESQHIGLIAFSMDGEPILGAVRSIPGLFVAGAFHSGGFSYNTSAGLLLAEMVTEKTPSVDVTAFSPDRFSTSAIEEYLLTPRVQGQAVGRRH